MKENSQRKCFKKQIRAETTHENKKNIAGRLPENSRNRFVDRQSKKNSKKDRPKKSSFH